MSEGDTLFQFDNSYARLPEAFYERIKPVAVRKPSLVKLNLELAHELDLNLKLSPAVMADYLSGNKIALGSEPIALAYAGHQFGHFVPQLGDGRANLLGEVLNQKGMRRDIQLKGSGPTRFSRRGDGRAALGPVIREYILSEAMAALAIPTTRSLSIVLSGESVHRDSELPGAILCRVAASHIRVGTFEYFAAKKDLDSLKKLTDYAIWRHCPGSTRLEFFDYVVKKQAELVWSWMNVGFIHGVMNTDNTAISGETLDYGPCAFLDDYSAMQVFSSIDHQGRYAFSRQAQMAYWNLTRLGSCLLLLFNETDLASKSVLEASLEGFSTTFNKLWTIGMLKKIGLTPKEEADMDLVQEFLEYLSKNQADYTLSFRFLSTLLTDAPEKHLFPLASESYKFDLPNAWIKKWKDRIELEKRTANQNNEFIVERMNAVNPAIIARNHIVEAIINHAIKGPLQGALDIFNAFLEALKDPFLKNTTHQPAIYGGNPVAFNLLEFYQHPKPHEKVTETFCGT